MTTFTIQSGQTSTLVLNSGDVCVVQSGGTALDTIVNNGAVLTIGRGGVASGAVINADGIERVSGGQDVGVTVNNGGQFNAPFGNISDTVFNAGAHGTVGANVSGMRVGNGATVALKNFFSTKMTVSGLVIDSG